MILLSLLPNPLCFHVTVVACMRLEKASLPKMQHNSSLVKVQHYCRLPGTSQVALALLPVMFPDVSWSRDYHFLSGPPPTMQHCKSLLPTAKLRTSTQKCKECFNWKDQVGPASLCDGKDGNRHKTGKTDTAPDAKGHLQLPERISNTEWLSHG